MKQSLEAFRQGRSHALPLSGSFPAGCRRDRSAVGGEADEHRLVAHSLPCQLTDIPLAELSHLRCAGIADVGVVLPNHDSGTASTPRQVPDKSFQCLRHVAIAEIPGVHPAAEHGPVVLLGVPDQPGILLGVEQLVLRHSAVALRQRSSISLNLEQLLHRLIFARPCYSEFSGVAVRLRILAECVEAAVAIAGPRRRLRVYLLQKADYLLHRGKQRVEIEPVEAGAPVLGLLCVVAMQPVDELEHVTIAPHPARKPLEVAECLKRVAVVAAASHPAVDAVRVRPVRLHCHCRKTLLLDQPPGYTRALVIKLVSSMAGLPQQHDLRITNQLQQQVVVVGTSGDWVGCVPDGGAQRGSSCLSHVGAPGENVNEPLLTRTLRPSGATAREPPRRSSAKNPRRRFLPTETGRQCGYKPSRLPRA